MLELIIGVIALFALICVVFAKIMNVLSGGKNFDLKTATIIFAFGVLAWGFFLVAFFASAQAMTKSSTITDDTNAVTTILQQDTSYITFSLFQGFSNILLLLNMVFWIAEILMLSVTTIMPQKYRD